jgi:beta-glucosidase/6-phospho-beta-glucosidase/beta-galactosidase
VVRILDFRKAVLAGIAGGVAMEVTLQGLARVGLSSVDIVAQLSSVGFAGNQVLAMAGAAVVHLAIGICWAIFYGYFFWARLKWPPALQGLAFSALPAVLAILIVFPQLELMRQHAAVVSLDVGSFLAPLRASSVAGLVVGHAVFGLVVGAIYTHPVGYAADRKPRRAAQRRATKELQPRRDHAPAGFMFATGIECSYPTIEHGRWRRDELDSTGHYAMWQRDFELARQIGITHIRYGPPLHLTFDAPGRYEWDFCDPQMEELRELGPEPIVDLCHFGVPSWLGNFQNPEIASALAGYASAFAERYPWVRFYTPVNEMYVCARMSALHGLWNEQRTDEASFVTAAFNLAQASIAMTDAILKRRPDAIFINSESSEFYQPCCPDDEVDRKAAFENERRFLPLDLIYAHPVSEMMRQYLYRHGVFDEQLQKFARRDVPRRSILGVDYYEWNERLIDRNGQPLALGELFGWYVIADQYYRRYQRPMMHTETNKMDADGAPRWLWRQWHNVQLLRRSGVPLVGFTWYSLTDQIDWSLAMKEALGIVFPVGLFDLNREARTVGLAYMHLIDLYRDQPDYQRCQALADIMA